MHCRKYTYQVVRCSQGGCTVGSTLPKKSKTKCLAFLTKHRELPKLSLWQVKLPWVTSVKLLGNTIENDLNGQKKDISIKRARYIDKNNELLQEIYFAHPDTLVKINMIYNSHFTGSVLWNLFCKESKMVENAWNVSIRKTLIYQDKLTDIWFNHCLKFHI